MTRAVEVLIEGRVQGVYYRGWTEEQANARGLRGWVRNNPDGSVSALFVGEAAAVEAMLAACRDGPRDAQVRGIDIREITPVPPAEGFRVLC